MNFSDPLLAFVALFVTDLCWGFYINKVKEGSPFYSAAWAVSLFVTGSIGTIAYVHNPWLLIPASFGAFFGTYAAVVINNFKRTR